jgi:uncharacterized protein (DUF2225 family)
MAGQGLDLMKLFALREEFGASASKGDVIFSPGQPADKFYVLMRGSVQLERPGAEPEVISPGDLFGEVDVFTERPRASQATALDDSSLLAFTRDTAVRLAEATPSFALVVIRKCCERVARAEDLLASAPKAAAPAPAQPPASEAAAEQPEHSDNGIEPAAGAGDTVGPVLAVDYAEVLWKKDVKCPNCRTTFHAWNVRSQGINVTDRDSDFMNHYSGVDPNWYAVWVCPNCYLAAYSDDFANMQSVQLARAKLRLEEAIKADPKKYDFTYYRDAALALRSYQLAVAFYDGMKGGNEKCAGLYHRMAWIERTRGDEQAEKAYLMKAREYYEKAFTTSDAAKQGVLWAYLIAEIAYRTGQYQDAVKWFGTAAQQPDFKSQPLLEKMVRDRWSEAGDLARAQGQQQAATA